MKGITNAQKDVSDLATKGELAQKADQSALEAKANQSDLTALQTAVTGKQDKLTAGTNITISGNTISASGGTITAGEGISVSGTQISLKSIGSSKSAGSGTSVPVVSIDAYGRVTSLSSTTIYPPTTIGEAGQVWMSDGDGAGYWGTVDGSPAISEVQVKIISVCGYTNSESVEAWYVAATWNVNANVLGTRSGTLTVAGTATSQSGSLTWTSTQTVNLSNEVLKKGAYNGLVGSNDYETTFKPRSSSATGSIAY